MWTVAGASRTGPERTEHTLTDLGLRRRVTFEPADRVGRYRILRPLGSGGMGTVYAACDPDLGRNIAIKVLHDRRGHDRKERAAVLLREAQTMAQFSHPNVVTVHDVGVHDGRVFVAMDWVQGPTLRSWMKGRPWEVVLRAFLQAGRGLAAVHAAGLVHRDFKPANVMLHPGGRVVVMDFGLARAPSSRPRSEGSDPMPAAERTFDDAVSQVGSVQGTPAYMAPEQHLAFDVDERADQFSYCVSAFEGLYGTRPFRARTVTELVMRITEGDIVATQRGKVPARIHRALVRGLAEVSSDRWPSMEALLDRLRPRGGGTWTLWSAGAAVAATAAALAIPPKDPCATGPNTVRATWTDDRRAALAGGLNDAPEAATRVTQTLDAYVETLAVAHDDACRTALDAPLLDRRTACLQHRAGALRATVDTLTSPAAETIGASRALQVVGQLPSVSRCLDPDVLANEADLPANDARRAQVRHAHDAVSEAMALKVAGDLEAAQPRAKAALVLARDTGYAPVEALALVTYGSTQEARGEYSEAAATFESAFYLARANHRDTTALRAATELVYAVGYRLQQREPAQTWVRHAESLLARQVPDDPDIRGLNARLVNNVATLDYSAGDYAAAAKGFEHTAKLRASLQGESAPDVAAAHSNLGLALTRLDRLDEALEHHARARASWEASLGPQHPMVAISVHNRALVLEQMERLDEAAAEYEKAIELRILSQGAEHPGVALSMNNLGHVRADQGRLLDALRLHQEALRLWHEAYGPDHRRVAEALSGIAEALHRMDRLEEAHSFADRSLATLETVMGPDHPDVGLALFVLGLIEADEGDTRGARSSLQRARDVLVAAWGAESDEVVRIDTRLAVLPQGA